MISGRGHELTDTAKHFTTLNCVLDETVSAMKKKNLVVVFETFSKHDPGLLL